MSKNSDIKTIARAVGNGKKALSLQSEKITLSNSTVETLTIPNNATYAFLMLEAEDSNSFSDAANIARITLDGTTPVSGIDPTNGVGYPMGHLDSWDLDEYDNLAKFRIILNEAGTGDTVLHVTYMA